MKRVYHPYTKWEEVKAGMWSKIPFGQEGAMLKKAIEFTGDAELYGNWMRKVIYEWPVSCENSLTAIGTNRKAWVGHAACCLAIGSPEDITRQAWGFLSDRQQKDANQQAENAIKLWEQNRRSEIISERGKNAVIWMAFPTAPQQNWRQQVLFQVTEEYAGQF